MQKSYDERLHLLIHDIGESDSAWKTLEKTKILIHDYIKDGPMIDDPKTTSFADYHCLPQQPIFKNYHKAHRPIIIESTNLIDKRLILTKLKNL